MVKVELTELIIMAEEQTQREASPFVDLTEHQVIDIIVKAELKRDAFELKFKVLSTSPLRKIMDIYRKKRSHRGVLIHEFRQDTARGKLVHAEDTPELLGMKTGGVIVACLKTPSELDKVFLNDIIFSS
ncbi:hypothetical protein EJ08DRAFT_675041 [Tothia fuscella]|uniref:Uncharacterized protein n=1 Tax=Tothia fuscella TaxID=1048955 RepID=A0A9P4U4B9_9PEZI|nr:hypothetical protein EJ08DRAFT_675041 [Tothia fuscella]